MSVERLRTILGHLKRKTVTRNLTSADGAPHKINSTEDREFRYTINNLLLTKQQRQFYEDNGYLVIPNLIDNRILDECRNHFVDICEGRKSVSSFSTLMKEMSLAKTGASGEFLYYKIQDILHDEVFLKYLANPQMLDYVECFTGSNITAVHSMLINKPPDANTNTSRHPLHQDLYYFAFRPTDRIVGCWTAMETVNENNGCLFIIPGSHKAGTLYKHDYPKTQVNAAFHGVLEFEDHPTIPLHMEKGDTVFLHPLVLHGSGVNTSKGFRKAISCHYASSDCYYVDVKGTVQEKIATEVEKLAQRRGAELDFITISKYRSRVVRGRHGGFTAI